MSQVFKIVSPEDLYAWDVIVGISLPGGEAFEIFDEPVTVTGRGHDLIFGSCGGHARTFLHFPETRFLERIDVS